MSYSVKGLLMGRRVTITWDAGQLSGDMLLTRIVQTEANVMEGQPVGPPTGPFTYHGHLRDPLSTLFLIRSLLDEPPEDFIGDLPTAPGSKNRIY